MMRKGAGGKREEIHGTGCKVPSLPTYGQWIFIFIFSHHKYTDTMAVASLLPVANTKRRRRRQPHHVSSGLSLLFICIFLLGCHCVDVTSQEIVASDNNDTTEQKITNEVTLDVASAATARRLIKRMKEVKSEIDKNNAHADDDEDDDSDGGVKSWDTLIQLLDHLASSSEQANNNESDNNDISLPNIHHHHLTQNEARKRALYWLSHQDTYEQKEVGKGFLHRYALAVIYFSLEGDSWNRCSSSSHSGTGSIKANDCPTDNERYLSSASHRLWDGVNGNRDDTITWLDLSNRNVYSERFLPLELTLLSPTLELLWVSENPDLSGTLPEYMGEFQKLVSLNVHKTSVGGTLPDSLYTLRKLSSLRLYKSKFTGSISPDIQNMGRLKWLWIHENEFTGVVPEEIGRLKKLEGVTLHGNKFDPIVKQVVKEEAKQEGEEKNTQAIQDKINELKAELERRKTQDKINELKEELARRKTQDKANELKEKLARRRSVEELQEQESQQEDKTLRRKLTDVDEKEDSKLEALNHHKTENDASDTIEVKETKEDPPKTDSQPQSDEKNDAEVTLRDKDNQNESTETEDWKSALKSDIIPESLCSLMKQKKLKHLWTDCEEDSLAQNEGSDLAIKNGNHACSCCTQCFPKKHHTANAAAIE